MRSKKSSSKPSPYPRLVPVGDSAVTVEFGDTIDIGLNNLVYSLAESINKDLNWIKDVVPTYDNEQTFESGYLPTITGESNFYVHMEDVTISYEEEVEKLKTQERIEEEFKRLEALRAELANWYALHYPKGRDADEDDNGDDEFGEGYGDHDPDEATGFGESIDPDDEGIDQ